MTKENNNLLEAKRSMKANIEFLEAVLGHLKGTNKLLRDRAVWAAWCLHRYINDHLIGDINEAMRVHAPKEGEHVQ